MRIERIRSEFDLAVEFIPFPLHPETPPEGLTLHQLFGGRALDIDASHARLTALMVAEGLPYGKRTMTYNSRLAQELGKWSDQQPGGESIHDALFRAYFVDGVNLAEPSVLLEVVESVGLSRSAARKVLTDRTMKDAVDGDWGQALATGVTAVPTFVMSGRRVVGAQPYEVLVDLVAAAGVRRR